ncbi:MAG: secretin N-terminal domain-containing protein [Candidatus Zixiibacteriota bacterium]
MKLANSLSPVRCSFDLRKIPWIRALLLLVLLFVGPAGADSTDTTQRPPAASDSAPATLPLLGPITLSAARIVDTNVIIPKLDFSAVPLFETLTALARAYNLSMFVDSSVVGSITLRLNNVSLNDALLFIIKEHKLSWERTGSIVKIYKPAPPQPVPKPLDLSYEQGKLTGDLPGVDIGTFVHRVAELTGKNIMLQGNPRGFVSGKVAGLGIDRALEVLLTTSGFTVSTADGIIYVSMAAESAQGVPKSRSLNVRCDSGLVTLDVINAPLAEVVATVGRQCGVSMSVQSQLEGTVSISFSDKPFDEALTSLLLTTSYTFRKVNNLYFVGKRDAEGLFDSKLIQLRHLIASDVEPLIPVTLSKQVAVKIVKEHNGLLVTGPRTSIAEIESFISRIDIPTAQVLFEVLVVDYSTTDRAEFSLTANNFGKDDKGHTYYPNIDLAANGDKINDNLNSLSKDLGIHSLGTLPSDFFVHLQMMQQQGKANVLSHPRIASLNGHSASIKIGTTQYFKLNSTTVYPSQQSNLSTQTSQRFETIEADMSLEVVPFVMTSGEIVVEVKPEFSTPAQALNDSIAPTINRRILNSTVRLRNGETIVLGGLAQTSKSATIQKFPILGSIPILGRLFQNRSTTDVSTELSIYITPFVYYGSEGSVDIEKVLKKQ